MHDDNGTAPDGRVTHTEEANQKEKKGNMSTNIRIETAEDLERIVAAQNTAIAGLGELVKKMDARIRLPKHFAVVERDGMP